MRLAASLIAALLLSGCATDGIVVRVPVPVPCAVDPGPDPVYVDSSENLQAAPNVFERVKLLLAGRQQRIDREQELKAANLGCRKP